MGPNRGGLQKVFDPLLKGFVYVSGQGCKMQLPKDERSSLGLTQPYLVLQVQIVPVSGLGYGENSGDDRAHAKYLCSPRFPLAYLQSGQGLHNLQCSAHHTMMCAQKRVSRPWALAEWSREQCRQRSCTCLSDHVSRYVSSSHGAEAHARCMLCSCSSPLLHRLCPCSQNTQCYRPVLCHACNK